VPAVISRAFRFLLRAVWCSALAASAAARAGSAEFEQHLAAKRWAEAEKIAAERMREAPGDAAAGGDLARVILASRQRGRMAEAAGLLEKAAAAQPGVAAWHFHLGEAYGRLAQAAGLGGLGLAGRSRAALERAVALEPGSFEFAYALAEFHLEAPGIAGGSVKKARQAAARFASVDRDGAALLEAQILVRQAEFARAAEILLGLARRDDDTLDVARRLLLVRTGSGLIEAGAPAAAEKVFARVTGEFPNNAAGHAGRGRALLAAGDAEGAAAEFERALEIEDSAEAWHRLGQAYQALGDKKQARHGLEKALARGLSGKAAEDARRRLAALGG
jgi:tetratricopeptide (TPR) repeat protein